MKCCISEKGGLETPDFLKDYVTFNIHRVDKTKDEDGTIRLFLLSSGKKDYMISGADLKDVSRKFPESVLHQHQRLMILRGIYPLIIGKQLKPMDSDCLESGYQ